MEIRPDLQYTEDHEWISLEGNIMTLGVSDFAQHSLGDIVYVELPEVGTVVDAKEAIGNVESVKAVSEIFTPVAGEIVAINKDLEDAPETLNTSPYDDGWILKIKVDTEDVRDAALMDDEAYTAFSNK